MTPPKRAKVAGKRKGPAKRKLAEEFPPGEVLTDTVGKSWKLGAPIGQGGFGLIYLADENSVKGVGADAPYVIKVEPSDNGPLFSELKFYMRAAKPDLIRGWLRANKMKYLGVPKYWGSGLHEKGGKTYRFMVMDRCGTDLQKFEQSAGRFPRKVVLQLGLRLLDILEYIHEHEYVHADIKASNLLLSHRDPNQVYLVDYGLAYRYCPEGVLKDYKENHKRCHDGTIEFTSIDAHKGAAPSRRGDMEIMVYCMVQWLCGRLPWSDNLRDPVYVRDSKIGSWENIPGFMSKCFSALDKPDEIQEFMEVVKSLSYTDTPPYDKLRSALRSGLKAIGAQDDGKLEFTTPLKKAGPASPVSKASPAASPVRKASASPARKASASPARKAAASPARKASASPVRKAAVKRKKASDEDAGEQLSKTDGSPMRKKMKVP